MGSFSLIHWIILGIIILLLFGGNRFSAMMSDVAKGLKSFKKGMTEDEEDAAAKPAPAAEPRRLRDDTVLDAAPERARDLDASEPRREP